MATPRSNISRPQESLVKRYQKAAALSAALVSATSNPGPLRPLEKQNQYQVASQLANTKARQQATQQPVSIPDNELSSYTEELNKKPTEENPALVEEHTQSKKPIGSFAQDFKQGVNERVAPIMALMNRSKIKNLQQDIQAQQKQLKIIDKQLEPEQKKLKIITQQKKRALMQDFVQAVLKSIAKGAAAGVTAIGIIMTIYYWFIKLIFIAIKYLILGKGGKMVKAVEKLAAAQKKKITEIEQTKKPVQTRIKTDSMNIVQLTELFKDSNAS
jgi:hypothetical protein